MDVCLWLELCWPLHIMVHLEAVLLSVDWIYNYRKNFLLLPITWVTKSDCSNFVIFCGIFPVSISISWYNGSFVFKSSFTDSWVVLQNKHTHEKLTFVFNFTNIRPLLSLLLGRNLETSDNPTEILKYCL